MGPTSVVSENVLVLDNDLYESPLNMLWVTDVTTKLL